METLKNSREFGRVVEGGSREILETITTYRLPNEEGKARVGISVSRRVGGSVKRNRVKRMMREAARRNKALLHEGEDIVLVARKRIVSAGYEDIERDIRKSFGRASGEV